MMFLFRRGLFVFLAALSLVSLPFKLLSQSEDISSERPLGLEIREFEALDGIERMDAVQMTALLRVGIINNAPFSVIEGGTEIRDASRTDYYLAGSIGREGEIILLQARIIEKNSVRISLSLSREIPQASIFEGLETFGQEIANEVSSLSVGATIQNAEKLIALGMYAEAHKRLLEIRRADTWALKADLLIEQARAGICSEELKTLERDLLLAVRAGAADVEYLELLSERASGALISVPEGAEYQALRDAISGFIRGRLGPRLDSARRAYYRAVMTQVADGLKAGALSDADRMLKDYLAIEGPSLIDGRYFRLRARVDASIAAAYRKRSRENLAGRNAFAAESYAGMSLDKELSPTSIELYRRIGKSNLERLYDKELTQARSRMGYRARKPQSLGFSLPFTTLSGAEARLPLQGVLPGLRLDYRRNLSLSPAIGLALGGALEYFSLPGGMRTAGIETTEAYALALAGLFRPSLNLGKGDLGLTISAQARVLNLKASIKENGIERDASGPKLSLGLGAEASYLHWINDTLALDVGLGVNAEYYLGAGLRLPGCFRLGLSLGF